MKERDHVPADERAGMGAEEIAPEIPHDLPLQARAIERLPESERALYRRACALLFAEGGLRSLIMGDVPLAGLGVYEALLARSWAARIDDPQEMVHLAEVAVEVAEALDPEEHGEQHVADLQARALAELGNAYRAADQLRSARRTLSSAYFPLLEGTNDPYLRARLFELDASLLGTFRQYRLALPQLWDVFTIYRDLGESHLAGRALITLALYTSYSGDNQEALKLNAEGLKLTDRQRDPILFMMAVHNHLLFLVDLGEYRRAERALFVNRHRLLYHRGIGAVRLRRLEGQINYGLGRLLSAEIAFREAKEQSVKNKKSFLSAIIALDHAMALVSLGREEEAEKEVIAAREIFLSLEIYREFLGTLIYLEERFRKGTATAELIAGTAEYLRRRELEVRPEDLR